MRSVSTKLRRQIEAVSADDPLVILAEVYAGELLQPVRVNSDVTDYRYDGEIWKGCGFSISFLTDDDRPPQARASIPNVDRRIGEAVRSLSLVRFNMRMLLKSDFDDSDPREPIGEPIPDYVALHLFLRNISCNAMTLTGDVASFDIAAEPWPKIRSTPNLLPGLYR